MATRLTLICQAPTSANRTASFTADEPLDGHNLEKARSVPFRFSEADIGVSSPALASRQTAEAMNINVRREPALRECDYGSWAGRSFDDVHVDDAKGLTLWLTDPASRPHGGETILAVLERASAWFAKRDQAGHTVAITHASIIRAAIVAALGAPPLAFWRIDVSPLSTTRLSQAAGRWTMASINQRPTRGLPSK